MLSIALGSRFIRLRRLLLYQTIDVLTFMAEVAKDLELQV
jgi:hypothetical protein